MRFSERLEQAQAALGESGAEALLLGPGPDLRWLTGYAPDPSERLTMLALTRQGRATLVVPRLEHAGARQSPAATGGFVEIESWEEIEDPVELVAERLGSVGRNGRNPKAGNARMLVSDQLRAAFLLGLQQRLRSASWGVASSVLRQLRAVKDADEIRLLRLAAEAADRVILAMTSARLVGRTEWAIAREINDRLLDEGHDSDPWAIVGSGPNSASPHHDATDRVVRAGEPLLLDIGASLGGYGSDITRTLWIGGAQRIAPDAEFANLYEAVEGAHEAATVALRPGVACEQIDEVARSAISSAGYGEQFIHRTGHGIGLEGHEHPYLVAGNREPLREGNVFSVEPGIYLDGRYGARIEDICVCTRSGADQLNTAPRGLIVVTGE